jgi:hypothetical protein
MTSQKMPFRRDGAPDPSILQRCQAAIRSLSIPRPPDMNTIRVTVENRRGRPLMLTAAAMAPACNGMWIATESIDYILYEQDTTPDNQLQIISHEIGHMVLDHQGIPLTSSEMGRLFFPDLDSAMVAATLAQSVSSAVYSPTEELEAETFALLLLERVQDVSF